MMLKCCSLTCLRNKFLDFKPGRGNVEIEDKKEQSWILTGPDGAIKLEYILKH